MPLEASRKTRNRHSAAQAADRKKGGQRAAATQTTEAAERRTPRSKTEGNRKADPHTAAPQDAERRHRQEARQTSAPLGREKKADY